MEANRILVVEDDRDIREELKYILGIRAMWYFRPEMEWKAWKLLDGKRFILLL